MPDRAELVTEVARVLAPGAPFVVHDYSVAATCAPRVVWAAVCHGIIIPLAAVKRSDVPLHRYLYTSVRDFDSVATICGGSPRPVSSTCATARSPAGSGTSSTPSSGDVPRDPLVRRRTGPPDLPAGAGPARGLPPAADPAPDCPRGPPPGRRARRRTARRGRRGRHRGLTAAVALAERGVDVELLEREPSLGGRVRSWDVTLEDGSASRMSRGFHAFFRQYYNLRALLRRTDPTLERLRPLHDYPLARADGPGDSFAGIPRQPPLNLAAFVARSPSFTAADLARVDIDQALGLLDLRFPQSFHDLDGVSASEVLDRLHFPAGARDLALEVFARSFFADPREFSGAELLAMFHLYFVGSAEGLLFDVPRDDYDSTLWAPLGRHLHAHGGRVRTGATVTHVTEGDDGRLVVHVSGDDAVAGTLEADAVVLALDPPALREVVAASPALGDEGWRSRVAGSAPPRPSPSAGSGSTGSSVTTARRSSGRAASARSTTSPSSSASRTTRRRGRASTAARSSRCTPTPCRSGRRRRRT